ncbi:Pathogenesis-related protein 1B [Capsicum chinense]|nr:Pathogenesis-related protein 1B [Capsicum chinense]
MKSDTRTKDGLKKVKSLKTINQTYIMKKSCTFWWILPGITVMVPGSRRLFSLVAWLVGEERKGRTEEDDLRLGEGGRSGGRRWSGCFDRRREDGHCWQQQRWIAGCGEKCCCRWSLLARRRRHWRRRGSAMLGRGWYPMWMVFGSHGCLSLSEGERTFEEGRRKRGRERLVVGIRGSRRWVEDGQVKVFQHIWGSDCGFRMRDGGICFDVEDFEETDRWSSFALWQPPNFQPQVQMFGSRCGTLGSDRLEGFAPESGHNRFQGSGLPRHSDIVLAHNNARAQVDVPLVPLKWNKTLDAYAYQYASTRLADCTLVHSYSPYGENLAMGYDIFSAVEAINLWVGEKHYDYASKSCKQDMCGHYTQVLWKNTHEVECGRLKCDNGEACGIKTSKELWGALEGEYKIEDTGIKKFLVAQFLDFKMIDSKSVVSQVYELQVIIHDLLAEGLIVNDAFQVVVIVEKLPPLWKDFKNYLKHKRKEMTVEDLIVRLHIKEDNKAAERRKKDEKGINQPKKKFKGKCFNYDKIGHKSTDCRSPKKGKKNNQANMIESNKECDDLCAMLSECNLVGNPREWWMDYGATRHVCANKELFSSFTRAQVEEMIYMAKVEGIGKVCLKMTLGKILTLNNVLYVPELRRNLICVSLKTRTNSNV